MEAVNLTASPRTALGKKVRALRRSGIIPLHVYGLAADPLSLQAPLVDLRVALKAAGYTTPITVKVPGGEESATLVREIARHPVTGDILHVDFLRVSRDVAVEVDVPIVLVNTEDAPGTRGGAGVVTQGLYEVTVLALPFDVPSEIEVDCSVLVDLDAVIRVEDLKLPPGVEHAGATDAQVAWIQPPRVSEEPTVAAEEAEEEAEAAEAEEEEPTEGEGESEESSEDES